DFEDNLEMTRNQQLKIFNRPLLERLGQQGMVGVCQRSTRQIPGFVPSQPRLIEQNPHQLRRRQGRMRVVELDCDLVGERGPTGVAASKRSYDIGKRTGDEKVLLYEPQALAQARRVI